MSNAKFPSSSSRTSRFHNTYTMRLRKDDTRSALAKRVIAAEATVTALRIQYLLARPGMFRHKIVALHLTPARMRLLQVLALTMASAQLLTLAGIFQNLRTAQRELRNLKTAGYVNLLPYPIFATGAFRYFYYLSKSGAGKPAVYHKIQGNTIEHDSLTALFLIQLFQVCAAQQLELRWYPPFSLKNKVCDGGVAVLRQQRPVRSIIIETDMATHDFTEITQKLTAYLPFLLNFPQRILVFLVNEAARAERIAKVVTDMIAGQPQYRARIVVICPQQLTKIDLAALLLP